MVTLEDFTIAWICVLPIETVAAISLLDERYESLPTPDDDNTYVFGRFAQHPVVITYPPSGGYGATSTAIVASRLLQTFRNIRFGLLVGIGSGAPSRDHDIRLGDVVVGRPDRGHGGIVQYGFGKTFPSDRFVQKSAHSGPPTLLLNVLAQLQAQHMIYKPMYVDYLSALAANDGQLDYPGTRYDNLYQSACVHSVESDDCSHCDPTATVARPERSSTAPQVHYGSIASGNQVIKDGSARDKLSRELGVLCFEMEAAGLMEDFPCLVIKGIADYADSHKNKRWQRYAATTAATYAKELLYCVHTDSLGTGDGVDADNASTSSGTLVSDSDNELINQAAARFAAAFLSDEKLKALCTACIPRMTASRFQGSVIKILSHYGANMKKSADTPLGQSVAYITRHRKELISYIIRERIFPSRSESAERQLRRMSEEETKRLKLLIESRFPAHRYGNARKAPLESVEIEQKGDGAEPEADMTDIPISLTETDLENIAGVVCTGEPYWNAYKELESIAFPAPIDELKRELQTQLSDNGSQYVVNCILQWEVLEFMESEEITETDLDSLLTLTGTFNRASVCSLGDYIHQQGSSGEAILGAVKELLAPYLTGGRPEAQSELITRTLASDHEFHIQMLPLDEGSEQAMLQIRDTFAQVLETLEQFSWLMATLRRCKGGGLTVSEIKAEFFDSEQLLVLSLLDQTADRKPNPRDAGQCWTSLFTESNLAYGFLLCGDNRPDEMLGLEIPFEVMAAFARVEYPILFGSQIILAGKSTLLMPVVSSEGCIQWHYAEGEGRFGSCRQHAKVLDSHLQTMDWEKLTSARAFLGFAKNVEIHLGTEYVPGTEIKDSMVPRSRDSLGILGEGPIGMEMGFKGFKTSLGGTWKLRKGEQAQIEDEYRSLIDYIQPAQYAPVLLYDCEAARAFLVPELIVILHMVSAYLRSCSSLPEDQIPYTQPSLDSGEAAFRVIEDKQDLNVPFKIGDSRKYRDIIHDFIHIWEHRRSQTSAAQSETNFHFRTSIRGWDFVDMQNKQYEFSEREISASNLFRQSTPIWWEIFSKQPCMVIFGSNINCPIRKVAHDTIQPYCNAWADLPTGKHLLLAQLSSLAQLSRTFYPRSKPTNSRYHMITDELAWARPKASTLFDSCTHGPSQPGHIDSKDHSCTPVQTMRKVGGWHTWKKTYSRSPGDVTSDDTKHGAVLFADDPRDFAPRSCVFVQPVPPPAASVAPVAPAPLTPASTPIHNNILALPHQPGLRPRPLKEYHMSVICCIFAGCLGFVYILSVL